MKSEASYSIRRVAAVLALEIILLAVLFDPKLARGGDNCYYMSLATSILKGSYNSEALIGNPPEVSVTPGYPLILAAFQALFGRGFLPAKIFSFICFIGALHLFGKILRACGMRKWIVRLIVAFGILNTTISEYSHYELTEAPFMLISAAAIAFYLKTLESRAMKHLVFAILFAAAAFYMRAAGIALTVAVGFAFLANKRWKELAIYAIAIALCFLPWFVRSMILGANVGGGIYVQAMIFDVSTGDPLSFFSLIKIAAANGVQYAFVTLPSLIFPSVHELLRNAPMLRYGFSAAVLLLFIWGMKNGARSAGNVCSAYLVVYLLMLVAFSRRSAPVRYTAVVYPIIAMYLVLGFEAAVRTFAARRAPRAAVALTIAIVVLVTPAYVRTSAKNVEMLRRYAAGDRYAGYPLSFVRFIEAHEWIARYGGANAGVISRKPTLTWWFSGRQAARYAYGTSREIVDGIGKIGARYVIVDRIYEETERYLLPAVREYPERFMVRHVTESPETHVLEYIARSGMDRGSDADGVEAGADAPAGSFGEVRR